MKKIVLKERYCASPKEGTRSSWTEYQVKEGRKVVGRYDLLSQATKDHPDATYEKDGSK